MPVYFQIVDRKYDVVLFEAIFVRPTTTVDLEERDVEETKKEIKPAYLVSSTYLAYYHSVVFFFDAKPPWRSSLQHHIEKVEVGRYIFVHLRNRLFFGCFVKGTKLEIFFFSSKSSY